MHGLRYEPKGKTLFSVKRIDKYKQMCASQLALITWTSVFQTEKREKSRGEKKRKQREEETKTSLQTQQALFWNPASVVSFNRTYGNSVSSVALWLTKYCVPCYCTAT